jgi:hypothetical protein
MALVYVISLAVVMVAAVVGFVMLSARKQHVVCPDNGQLVDVHCDPIRAAGAVFKGGHLYVTDCERWPEKAGCDHACEKQLRR